MSELVSGVSTSIKIRQQKHIAIGIGLFFLLILVILLSVGIGRADLTPTVVTRVVLAKVTGIESFASDIPDHFQAIVWDVRVPRILSAVLIGAGLAVSGAVFQSILRNPLADPYTIGVSTGAAFGASIAIFVNIILGLYMPITPFALLGAFVSLMLVIAIARKNGVISSNNLIIAGIIVGSILSAGMSFLKSAAGENVAAIVHWLLGSLASRSWNHIMLLLPFIVIGCGLSIQFASRLDIMSLGEREARHLGVDPQKTMRLYLIIGSCMTAVCVSVGGIIGFVGLIVPHMIRFGLTSRNAILIPLSTVAGALLLLMADNVSRILFNVEVPVGVLTTLLGGPFFIWLFMKSGKGRA